MDQFGNYLYCSSSSDFYNDYNQDFDLDDFDFDDYWYTNFILTFFKQLKYSISQSQVFLSYLILKWEHCINSFFK